MLAGTLLKEAFLRQYGFNEEAARTLASSDNVLDLFQEIKTLDVEELKDSAQQLQDAMNENPQIIETLERQLSADPSLQEDVMNMARNDPAALENKIPQMLSHPDQVAAVLSGDIPAASIDQSVPAVSDPETADPETATTDGTVISEEAIAASLAIQRSFNESADGEVQGMETAAPTSAPETTTEQIVDTLEDLISRPGAEEFFDRVENNPELSAALGNVLDGAESDPERTLALLNEFKTRADNDPEFFNKANNFMDERPGMVKNFAETFANDPEKAFARLDQALALDNFMDQAEPMLAGFLGPELSGKIMGFMGDLLEMLMPMMDMFDGLKETLSGDQAQEPAAQTNAPEGQESLSVQLRTRTGADGNVNLYDQDGRQVRIQLVEEREADAEGPAEQQRRGGQAAAAPGMD